MSRQIHNSKKAKTTDSLAELSQDHYLANAEWRKQKKGTTVQEQPNSKVANTAENIPVQQSSELGLEHPDFVRWRKEKTEENAERLREAMPDLNKKKAIAYLAAKPYVTKMDIKKLLETKAFKSNYLIKKQEQKKKEVLLLN